MIKEIIDPIRELEEKIREVCILLEKEKTLLEWIHLRNVNWLEDHNGIERYLRVRGLYIDYPEELEKLVREYYGDNVKIEELVLAINGERKGLLLHLSKKVYNEYDRYVGTDYWTIDFMRFLETLIERRKQEKDKFATTVKKLISELSKLA